MKKIFFLMILIGSTLSLLGSCAKDDDDAASTAASDIAGSGTTASGTIEGKSDLTGTFHTSWQGDEPSGGCVSNSSAISAHTYLASDTKSFKKMYCECTLSLVFSNQLRIPWYSPVQIWDKQGGILNKLTVC